MDDSRPSARTATDDIDASLIPDEGDAASDFFHALGCQLRILRERKGWSRGEFGDRIGYSEDLVSSVERGRRVPQAAYLETADELLDAAGLLKATIEDVAKAKSKARVKHPAWFRQYAQLETQAEELHIYSTMAIPGLMQSEAYAREVFSSSQPLLDPDVVESRIAARLARQELLHRTPPAVVTTVLHERVLRQAIGGEEVQQAQLAQLLRIAGLKNVEVQVMPSDSTGHAGLNGPFTLITPHRRAQIAYLEVQHVSRLVTDPHDVRRLATKYGSLRAAALTPRESMILIAKMLEAR